MNFKAGIIGAGGIAGLGVLGLHDQADIGHKKFRESHAGGYHATEGIELAAIADIDREKLERFGHAWDIPANQRYADHEVMLTREDLDVVSVCTPSYLHHDHVIDAAQSEANPDVIWCEKPIASSVKEAKGMISVCERTDTELLINHSFRFTEKQRKLRKLIHRDKIIGDVLAVTGQFRMELLRNSTHLLDTLVHLLDARATRVSGYLTEENEAIDALEADKIVDDSGGGGFVVMDDNTFVTIDCTVPRAPSSMQFQFIGSEGKLYLNNDDGEWRYWRLVDGAHVEEPLPSIETGWTWGEDYGDAFPIAAQHVLDLLEGRTQNWSTGETATRSLEIIVGMYVSHYTNGQIEIPLPEPLQSVQITSW